MGADHVVLCGPGSWSGSESARIGYRTVTHW